MTNYEVYCQSIEDMAKLMSRFTGCTEKGTMGWLGE